MKVTKALLVIFLPLLFNLQAKACSCVGPDKFVESVGPYMMEVEVLDVIALDTFKGGYTAARVKVKRRMKGDYKGDTLLIPNDKGFECFQGLPNQEKGMQYMITGDLLNEWNSFGTKMNHSYYGKMMLLDLCSENVLYLDGEQVIGNITKNKLSRRTVEHRVRRILMSTESYQNWDTNRRSFPKLKRVLQSMSIAKLERKLRVKNLI